MPLSQQEMHTQECLGVLTGRNPQDLILACLEDMQWDFLYLSIGHVVLLRASRTARLNMPEHHHVCTTPFQL
jgi:hypothetical protein